MKSVMLSIKPKFCELIANGKKTVEVRKTKPKIEIPFKCYIYCTSAAPYLVYGDRFNGQSFITEYSTLHGYSRKRADEIWGIMNGKIIGEFVCDKIVDIDYGIEEGVYFDGKYQKGFDIYGKGNNATCLSFLELEKYLTNGEGYGWYISDLVIYGEPKELGEFRKPCKYGEKSDRPCFTCNKSGYAVDMQIDCFNVVTRPPQSWCYVEELI